MLVIHINSFKGLPFIFLHRRIVVFFVVEVNALDYIGVALQTRVFNVKACDHRFPKDRIFLWSNEEELNLQDLLFAQVRDVNLNLQVHQSSPLRNFSKLKLAVFAIYILVVTFDHG